MRPDMHYGEAPRILTKWQFPEWQEFLHYFYLPVKFPGNRTVRLPPRLEFLHPLIEVCLHDFHTQVDDIEEHYVYLTAKHGYATPENPLNRPGWHCDGFGTKDINYVWSDRYPTRFATHKFFEKISSDHNISLAQFDMHAHTTFIPDDGLLLALNPYVVHTTPRVDPPGGNRRFVKVSISRDRYNLLGNSHNYLFDYKWRMWDRSEIRNNPQYAGRDSGPND